MKTKRIMLLSWVEVGPRDNIEIDWPRVHRELGEDQVKWFLGQSPTDCQLFLDQVNEQCRLVAEFYTDPSLVLYHLMWAK